MRVAFLHTDFRLYWPDRLNALRQYLAARGDELHVMEVAGKGSPYEFSDTDGTDEEWWHILFPTHRAEDIAPTDASEIIHKHLNRLMPDVLFSGAFAFYAGAAGIRWARSNKVPIVMFDNARLSDVPRSKFVNLIKKRFYANIDAMLIPAESHVHTYEYWGVKKDKLFFGLNTVDNEGWSSIVSDKQRVEKVKSQFSLPTRFFLGVGRQVEKKNWALLIEAYSKLPLERQKEVPLILVGDGPERRNLELLSQEKAINIRFLDFQKRDILAPLYYLADATVLPSLHGETWGLTVNETMACHGLPIVSDACGCCETLVSHGKTGLAFKSSDIASLLSALRRVSDMREEERAQFTRRAYSHICDWGLDRFCTGVDEAIQLVGSSRRGSAHFIDRIILSKWKGRYCPT